LSPKIGGSSKSLALGGTKPSPSAPEQTNENTQAPIGYQKRLGCGKSGQPYVEIPRL